MHTYRDGILSTRGLTSCFLAMGVGMRMEERRRNFFHSGILRVPRACGGTIFTSVGAIRSLSGAATESIGRIEKVPQRRVWNRWRRAIFYQEEERLYE